MIKPPSPFHSISTERMVALAVALDAVASGTLKPGTSDYTELVDQVTLSEAQQEVGHEETGPLLDELAFALQGRHPEIAAALTAWHAWNYRSGVTWAEALAEGADAVKDEAAALTAA